MENYKSILLKLCIFVAIVLPVSVFAQNGNTQLIVSEFNNSIEDSVSSPNTLHGTEYNVENMEQVHKMLDSIFNEFGGDLDMRMGNMSFKLDSIYRDFMPFNDLGFDMDSFF